MRFIATLSLIIFVFVICISGEIYADILEGIGEEQNLIEKDITGKKIPSFRLKNLSDDEVLLENLREHKLMIFLYSSKCPYSINSAKYLDELLKDNAKVKLLAICLDGEIGNKSEGGKTLRQVSEDFYKKYLKNVENSEVLLIDDTFRSDYSRFFNMSSLQTSPLHLFVDGNARVKVYIKGSCEKDDVEKSINKLAE